MTSVPAFLIDEDFDNDILRGLLRKLPDMDIVRVQDIGLSGASDPGILAWAAEHGRILLTHDVSTMTAHAMERVRPANARHFRREPVRAGRCGN